jgi:hypothetical protein
MREWSSSDIDHKSPAGLLLTSQQLNQSSKMYAMVQHVEISAEFSEAFLLTSYW